MVMGPSRLERLAVGGWRLVAVGGGWRLAVGGPWVLSLRAVLNKKKDGFLRTAVLLWQPPPPTLAYQWQWLIQQCTSVAGSSDQQQSTFQAHAGATPARVADRVLMLLTGELRVVATLAARRCRRLLPRTIA